MSKVIIAGSRSIGDMHHVEKAIRLSGFDITQVVSGGIRGVDGLGSDWANARADHWEKPRNVSVKYFKIDRENGKNAELLRNEEKAKYADALIAVWDGSSRGTKHMIAEAKKQGLKVFVYKPFKRE